MENGKDTETVSSERDHSQERHSRKSAEALGAQPMGACVRQEGLCSTKS